VAHKRCARVLAGKRLAMSLPARTRAHRWLHLIFKDHKRRPRIKPSLRDEEKIRATRKDVGNDKVSNLPHTPAVGRLETCPTLFRRSHSRVRKTRPETM